MKPITQTGTKGLFLYLRQQFPDVYQQVAKQISQAGSLAGFGDIEPAAAASSAPPSSSLADTIKQIANTVASGYLSIEQQKAQSKILDAQISQAQKGLPPLNIDPRAYGLPGAPPAQSMLASIPPWGIWAALAAVGLLIFTRMSSRPRLRLANPRRSPRSSARRVRLDRGGYDKQGRYWGIGAPLWLVHRDPYGDGEHVRAATRAEALAKAKG